MANDEQKDPLNRLVDRFRGSSGDGGRKSDPSQRKVHFSIWYFIAALLVIMWFQTFVSEQQTNRISYSEFKQLIHPFFFFFSSFFFFVFDASVGLPLMY